ncbi:MAG: hypothetical protein F6K19_34705 [Cyanothece sp. SIO1E1]|nr:hypothetical protein [Cyanothece sp. SIO1E1]
MAAFDAVSPNGSLDLKLVTRVCHLQRALDQALTSLDELRSEVQDQKLLESQLAKTESIANVQQQAIAQLQLQLLQKRQWQDQVLQQLAASVRGLIQAQQIELERLHVCIQQSQTEVQAYLVRLKEQCQESQTSLSSAQQQRLELESEVLVARMLTVSLGTQLGTAQQHIQALDAILSQHRTDLARIDTAPNELNSVVDQPVDQQPLVDSISHTQLGNLEHNTTTSALLQELQINQLKVEELETGLAEQFKLQAQLKHRCQEISAERDYYKQRVDDLEQQQAQMQEQIFQQAHQASEYEAAVQYWKDRYFANQGIG